jgi:hypothetical protein
MNESRPIKIQEQHSRSPNPSTGTGGGREVAGDLEDDAGVAEPRFGSEGLRRRRRRDGASPPFFSVSAPFLCG